MRGAPNKNTYAGKSKEKSIADQIFEYLHKVRTEDEDINYSEVSDRGDEYPGSRSAAGSLFGSNKPVEKRIPDRPNITFTSVMPKQSSALTTKATDKAGGFLKSIGDIKIGDIDDTIRELTGSPLIRSGALGLLGAGALYALYPWLDKPDPVYSKLYGGDRAYNTRRNWLTALTGIGLTGLGIYASSHPNIKGSWYKYLPKKDGMRKNNSMLGPADFVPIGFAQQAVMDNPNMTLDNKYRAISMLNSMGGPNTPVSSPDIVSAAVNTGASAHGYPVGRATVGAIADSLLTYAGAKAFGASDPGGLAAKVGLGSLGVRLLGSMF